LRVTEIRVKRHHDKGGHENNRRSNGSDEKLRVKESKGLGKL